MKLILAFSILLKSGMARVVFYGMQSSDANTISSLIDNSLDKHRSDLTEFMNGLDVVSSHTTDWDGVLDVLIEVHSAWRRDMSCIPRLHEKNEQIVLDLLRKRVSPLVYGILDKPCNSHYPLRSDDKYTDNISSYSSIQQLLIHISRDWGDVGEGVREETYTNGIVAALKEHVHLVSPNKSDSLPLKILVPGAGMGRLAMEIAAVGNFDVEANECSGIMVYAMHAMLTDILPNYAVGEVMEYYPFLMFNLMDEWKFNARMKPSFFPSQDSRTIIEWIQSSSTLNSRRGSFNVQYGEFLSFYGEDSRRSAFEVVVTCFFIDTISNILDVLLVIQHVLKPGGLWINAGPLHYHGKSKVPYSNHQLEDIIASLNFSCLHKRVINSNYLGDDQQFMIHQRYNFPLSIWKKRCEDEIPPSSSKSTLQRVSEMRKDQSYFYTRSSNKSENFTLVR